MEKNARVGGVEIVPFSEKWMDGYIDLRAEDDTKDPLYSTHETRDSIRQRILLQISAGSTKVHLLAIDRGKVVGSARGILRPTCGGGASGIATLVLQVAKTHRGKGIGTRLTDLLCDELKAQGVKGLETALMDSWTDWKRFLTKTGFAPHERFYDVVLASDMPITALLHEVEERIRPIRLPEDRARIIELFNRERGKDLPTECAVVPGQPAWWEVEPLASAFDPEGFLIAEDKSTGELLGFVDSFFFPGEKPWGLVDYVDVAERLVRTRLRERLLLQACHWLRGKGALEIRDRVHPEYRKEGALFQEAGFKAVNPAEVWRKTIH
jgi:GNAT superfamily N-acetyltransferase